MKVIDISSPKFPNTFAMVDDEDFERINAHKWYAKTARRTLYAYRAPGLPKTALIRMHREILQPPHGLFADHIDGNGLNNTRANLRVCTNAQNSRNQRPQVGRSSRFKGVSWEKRKKKWLAQIQKDGKQFYIGYFTDETEAAKAYNKKANDIFGEYSKPNDVAYALMVLEAK